MKITDLLPKLKSVLASLFASLASPSASLKE